jgi:hypothetical protein
MTKEHSNAGQAVAEIALAMPEHPTSGDLLRALSAAHQAGYEQATHDLALGILKGAPVNGIQRQGL